MDLTIEGTALTLFWGTFVANFVWYKFILCRVNRYAVLNKTKTYASDLAKYVVSNSKRVFREGFQARYGWKDRNRNE